MYLPVLADTDVKVEKKKDIVAVAGMFAYTSSLSFPPLVKVCSDFFLTFR